MIHRANRLRQVTADQIVADLQYQFRPPPARETKAQPQHDADQRIGIAGANNDIGCRLGDHRRQMLQQRQRRHPHRPGAGNGEKGQGAQMLAQRALVAGHRQPHLGATGGQAGGQPQRHLFGAAGIKRLQNDKDFQPLCADIRRVERRRHIRPGEGESRVRGHGNSHNQVRCLGIQVTLN